MVNGYVFFTLGGCIHSLLAFVQGWGSAPWVGWLCDRGFVLLFLRCFFGSYLVVLFFGADLWAAWLPTRVASEWASCDLRANL